MVNEAWFTLGRLHVSVLFCNGLGSFSMFCMNNCDNKILVVMLLVFFILCSKCFFTFILS